MTASIRQHVAELHPRLRARRSTADVIRDHARDHHRTAAIGHYHVEDNAGELIGPGSSDRRPSGWYDGGGVVMTRERS